MFASRRERYVRDSPSLLYSNLLILFTARRTSMFSARNRNKCSQQSFRHHRPQSPFLPCMANFSAMLDVFVSSITQVSTGARVTGFTPVSTFKARIAAVSPTAAATLSRLAMLVVNKTNGRCSATLKTCICSTIEISPVRLRVTRLRSSKIHVYSRTR